MESVFVYPLLVAVLGGVGVYVFQFFQKRAAIRRAITIDVNALLEMSRENADYLDRTDHYWLAPGETLRKAPVAFGPRDQLFSAILSELHVIGARNFERVLAFYSYYRYCEQLRVELFREIQSHREAPKDVSSDLVRLWNEERRRVANAYRILCRAYRSDVRLRDLRTRYDLPSAAAVEQAARKS